MGSWRGSEQTIGQNFKMKLLLALCMLGLATSSQDYKKFMKWAGTKAMESCWGEDNMKIHTVNMKKAVAKCQQSDAPELNLPPFRAANRFVNKLVGMAGHREEEKDQLESLIQFMKFTMMMMMKNMNEPSGSYKQYNSEYKSSGSNNFLKSQSQEDMWKAISQMRFKRQADNSLALNDRLKEKLEGMMEEHVQKVSNMTCVLKELNVIDHHNNIDVNALKEDSKQYRMPSQWFADKYEVILDSCSQVAESLPARLQEEYVPKNYNGPLKNLGKIKSFMDCCKSAKMKLCMQQDTKKKIETNFGPLEELMEGFNNQLTEEQVFFMVNELLRGPEDEFM